MSSSSFLNLSSGECIIYYCCLRAGIENISKLYGRWITDLRDLRFFLEWDLAFLTLFGFDAVFESDLCLLFDRFEVLTLLTEHFDCEFFFYLSPTFVEV